MMYDRGRANRDAGQDLQNILKIVNLPPIHILLPVDHHWQQYGRTSQWNQRRHTYVGHRHVHHGQSAWPNLEELTTALRIRSLLDARLVPGAWPTGHPCLRGQTYQCRNEKARILTDIEYQSQTLNCFSPRDRWSERERQPWSRAPLHRPSTTNNQLLGLRIRVQKILHRIQSLEHIFQCPKSTAHILRIRISIIPQLFFSMQTIDEPPNIIKQIEEPKPGEEESKLGRGIQAR